MMSQEPTVPDEERLPDAARLQPSTGFDWNGPAGFWIVVIALVAAFVAIGLYLA